MAYIVNHIIIPKILLYLVFIYQMYPNLKLGNDIIYLLRQGNRAISYTKKTHN